ncbi:MAG: hypothetical protein JWQ18_23 [Conexibacter sp.]|nr:hypothetical protein [Conexibacter sp.]
MDYADDDKVLEFAETTRRFILDDLARMLDMPVGGNFAVAGLIGAGCEALGQLRGLKGAYPGAPVLAEILPAAYQPVAESLLKAMRNGLLHNYWPNEIKIGDTLIRLSISWRETPHLSWHTDEDGVPTLVLRAPDLVAGLHERWAVFARLLEHRDADALASARRDLQKHGRRDTIAAAQPEGRAWLRLLDEHAPATPPG